MQQQRALSENISAEVTEEDLEVNFLSSDENYNPLFRYGLQTLRGQILI